jgi:hypothetical protein
MDALLRMMNDIWREIAIPEQYHGRPISDFFEFAFAGLHHYKLLRDKFDADIEGLRPRFLDPSAPNYFFQTASQKLVPGDGLARYIRQLWETIHENRELNVPSQRSMLSHFKCEESVKEELTEFTQFAEIMESRLARGEQIDDFYGAFAPQIDARLTSYRESTVRYLPDVVKASESSLISAILAVILPLFDRHRDGWSKAVESEFADCLEQLGAALESDRPWLTLAETARDLLVAKFERLCQIPSWPDFPDALNADAGKVRALLDDRLAARRKVLVDALCTEVTRSAQLAFEHDTVKLFRASPPDLWRALGDAAKGAAEGAYARIRAVLDVASPGAAPSRAPIADALQATLDELTADAYDALDTRLHATFERHFNRTPDDFVRVWTEGDDVDEIARVAREAALVFFQIYLRRSKIELVASADGFRVAASAVKGVDTARHAQMMALFQMETERAIEAAKTLVKAHTRAIAIPSWAWFLLFLLGWKEVLWLLKHPALAALVFGLGGLVYLLMQFNILGPLISAIKDRAVEYLQGSEEEDAVERHETPPIRSRSSDAGGMELEEGVHEVERLKSPDVGMPLPGVGPRKRPKARKRPGKTSAELERSASRTASEGDDDGE